MDRKWASMFALGAALVLLLVACSKGSSSSSSDTSSTGSDSGYGASYGEPSPAMGSDGDTASTDRATIDGQSVELYGEADVTGKTSVKVAAETQNGENYFAPTVITGTPGQKVTVQLVNTSPSVPHNFSVDGTDVNVDLDPGADATATVTIPDSGSVVFFCEYHRSSGMVGELKAA